MIPAYKEEVKITVFETDPNSTLEQQVSQLRDQVIKLSETVDYLLRERSRLRSELDHFRVFLNDGK